MIFINQLGFLDIIFRFFQNFFKSFRCFSVSRDANFVYDALSFVHISLVPVETVDASLSRLLNNVLLDKNILFAPDFDNFCHELIMVKVNARKS